MKERNKQMDVLLCMGIVLVVLGHVGENSWRTTLFNWFVIYSFHMPLFFFISGYFYKPEREANYGRTLWYLVKKLVVPYYIWNAIYAVVIFALKDAELVPFKIDRSLKTFLLTPWMKGDQYQLNSPAWFMLTLFLIEVVYLTIHKVCGMLKLKNEFILTIPFLLMTFYGGKMMLDGVAKDGWKLTIAKMLFGIGFYQLGRLYKTNLEKWDKLNNVAYFGIILVVQYFLMVNTKSFPYISMWNGGMSNMKGKPWLPIIAALAGIAFFLRVSKLLTPSFGESKLVRALSMSTKSIMLHHYAVIVYFNVALTLINRHICELKYFDTKWNSVLYKYPGPHNSVSMFCLVYILLCLFVPMFGNILFRKVKEEIVKKKNSANKTLLAEA